MEINIYLHEEPHELARQGEEELFLEGEPLEKFSRSLYSVEITLDVLETGEATITHVNGREVTK